MKKTTQLRNLITSQDTEFILEAHNGLSAKIVEEAGFKGIWGSGLSISASLGVRDNNEASWTQVLDVCEYMSDATTIPILLDGDTGYGNFNNMRRLVKKLEQRDVAGVCIEDKIFPKTNSFLRGEAQPLADIDEFCGKIKAGKDSQSDEDFSIVARVEAFIAGWGLDEAIKRAEAYRKAGADAILIHSKLTNSSEIFSFLKEWDNRHPVIIVPTKFYTTPTDDFRKNNVSLVIWANHMVRGAVQKMQGIAKQIYTDQNLMNVEDNVVPVKELFRLQDDAEIAEAEKLYLTSASKNTSATILAASPGKALGKLTETCPKTMLKVGDKTILERIINSLNEYDVKDINVVAGYKKETVDLPNINLESNDEYETTGQLYTLSKSNLNPENENLVIFGDILYKKFIVQMLLEEEEDIVVVVDSNIKPEMQNKSDFIYATEPDTQSYFNKTSYVKSIEFANANSKYSGEWIGVLKLSVKGTEIVRNYISEKQETVEFKTADIRDMLNQLIQDGHKIKIKYISGHWVDVNNISDLTLANEFSA